MGLGSEIDLDILYLLQVHPADPVRFEFNYIEAPAFSIDCDSRRCSELYRRSFEVGQHAEKVTGHVKYLYPSQVTIGHENPVFESRYTLGAKQLARFNTPAPDETDEFPAGVEDLYPSVDGFDHKNIALTGDVDKKRKPELPSALPGAAPNLFETVVQKVIDMELMVVIVNDIELLPGRVYRHVRRIRGRARRGGW